MVLTPRGYRFISLSRLILLLYSSFPGDIDIQFLFQVPLAACCFLLAACQMILQSTPSPLVITDPVITQHFNIGVNINIGIVANINGSDIPICGTWSCDNSLNHVLSDPDEKLATNYSCFHEMHNWRKLRESCHTLHEIYDLIRSDTISRNPCPSSSIPCCHY